MFSMPTLIGEIKPVVLVKFEFDKREKLEVKCFLRKFRTIRILIQKKKRRILSRRVVYKCCVFDFGVDVGNRTGGGSELLV